MTSLGPVSFTGSTLLHGLDELGRGVGGGQTDRQTALNHMCEISVHHFVIYSSVLQVLPEPSLIYVASVAFNENETVSSYK
jgi:hypothetical protein